jgi:hypothetical protein
MGSVTLIETVYVPFLPAFTATACGAERSKVHGEVVIGRTPILSATGKTPTSGSVMSSQ